MRISTYITLPRLYSVYQKVVHSDGSTEWAGVHRLPIASMLRQRRELRDRGYRVVIRLDGELGPSYKD